MKDKVEIRKVKNGDENILAYIQTESWKNAFNNILSKEDLDKYTNVDRAEEIYSNLFAKGVGNGYILSVNNAPHCMAYWGNTREENMDGYAELICIHSLQGNWGKGYGSVMMKHILKEIKEAGYNKVMLWVFEENNRARKFYGNNGFVLTNKTKSFCDAIEVMYCKEF